MTDRELMQQALDALENVWVFVNSREKIKQPEGGDWYREVVETLRARLAQPEQEPVAWNWMQEGNPYSPAYYGNQPDADIAEVAARNGKTVRLLYTAPPQREWVGLTDEELLAIMQSAKDFQGRIAMTWVNHENQTYVTDVGNRITRAIEAKLKEKNT